MEKAEEKKLKKKANKLTKKQLEARQQELAAQNGIYSEQLAELEVNHASLLRSKLVAMKMGEEGADTLTEIEAKIGICEKEIERLEGLYDKNTSMIRILQEVLASRITGRNDGIRIGLGWFTALSTATLAGLGLYAGYRTDIDGSMKNKSPLLSFERCLGWLKSLRS